MEIKDVGFIMVKCIKDVEDSENYSNEYSGYTCGEEKYSTGEVFLIDSTMGNKYIKDYPDCFEEIIMKEKDWMELAKNRIEYANHALIGRNIDTSEYLYSKKKEIQHAEELLLTCLDKKENLSELISLIYRMPDEKSTYWYDTPSETPLCNIKKALSNALKSGITSSEINSMVISQTDNEKGKEHGDK